MEESSKEIKTEFQDSYGFIFVKYSLLLISAFLYLGFHAYEMAFWVFLGYMFFTDWAWETLWNSR